MQRESSKIPTLHPALVQPQPPEVPQDCGQDCGPGVQLHLQEVCQNYGQDWAPRIRLHPQDVSRDCVQGIQLDHLHPRDVQDCDQFLLQLSLLRSQSAHQDHVQDAQMDELQVHIFNFDFSSTLIFSRIFTQTGPKVVPRWINVKLKVFIQTILKFLLKWTSFQVQILFEYLIFRLS